MKKISLLLVTLFTLGFFSCDMEKYPSSAIQIDDYYKIPADFTAARVGIYNYFRSVTTGGFVVTPDIQADEFNAKLGFSNTFGDFYRWTFTANEGTIEGIWYGYYTLINNCNLFINNANKILETRDKNFSNEELALLYAYTGEAYFARAFCYSQLASLYCKDYEPTSAETDHGVMLQLEYNKNPNDNTTYPGRSSMATTYKQIVIDLDSAEVRLGTAVDGLKIPNEKDPFSTVGEQRSPYITVDAVSALQARVALQMHEYTIAAKKATSIMSNYTLLSTAARLENMWWEDGNGNGASEIIWLIAMTKKEEAGAQTGLPFVGLQDYDKDFIPTADLLDLYDIDNDKRFSVYFQEAPLKVASGAKADVYYFSKYPGNSYYNTLSSETKCVNQAKPFHISEMYLVAAEAYAQMSDLQNATKYLNQLKSKRISGYQSPTFANVEEFMTELKKERARELAGEGFRLMDLKRWNMGVKRTGSQDQRLILFPGDITTDKLDRPANDPRMIWPIPKSEMDANPQMKGQQNPGY